jgi:hypothetical protein
MARYRPRHRGRPANRDGKAFLVALGALLLLAVFIVVVAL